MANPRDNLLFVIYVGTRRLAGLLAEGTGEKVNLLRFREISNPAGFQKGEVSELDSAQGTVGELIRLLELGEEAGELPCYVLLSGHGLKMARFSSSLYFTGYPRVVTTHEVGRVIEQTRAIAPLPLNDWILQAVPESFWVNDLAGVRNPLGLEAQRLAVTLQIYTTGYASFRNLSRLFENLEFNLQGYFPKTLALPQGTLTGQEREGEALVIDFSDEVTHLVLTHEGEIVSTRSLPLGSGFLTSRVAETWNLPIRGAERLKENFGSLQEKLEFAEELIPLAERDGQKNHHLKRAEFHWAFVRFGEELFAKIEKEVTDFLAKEKRPYAPLILTGGGAKLDGLLDFFSQRFTIPIRLATPRQVEAPAEILTDPAFCGLVGLVRWLGERGRKKSWTPPPKNLLGRTASQVKEWLAAYF